MKQYLKETEVAALIGRSVKTLRNDRCHKRGIPYLRVFGRSIRYRLSDVVDYMEKNMVQTDAA
jgi:hypothetical protein